LGDEDQSSSCLRWPPKRTGTAIVVIRMGLVVVLVWIGSLKVFHYEAEGIVPFVANSPFMSFAYHQPTGEYRQQ